jgi:hypothetical protein
VRTKDGQTGIDHGRTDHNQGEGSQREESSLETKEKTQPSPHESAGYEYEEKIDNVLEVTSS